MYEELDKYGPQSPSSAFGEDWPDKGLIQYIAPIIKSVYEILPKGTSVGICAETLDDNSFTLTFEVDSAAS